MNGSLPYKEVNQFLHNLNFQGTINMEINPLSFETLSDYVKGLLDSYRILLNIDNPWRRISKSLLCKFMKPLIQWKIKGIEPRFQDYKQKEHSS